MANDKSASIVHLHQPKRPMTAAERARNYRRRLKEKANGGTVTAPPSPTLASPTREIEPLRASRSITSPVTASRRSLASILLAVAAFGLAGVGVTMNGWFAHSLGSSNIAGWLFLAIGVAADLVALVAPSSAAALWYARRRATAAAGWAIWAMTFAFAVTAGIGFASMNITDVTQARASRVTPAVETARASLADAMTARDRECAGGVGKNCRQREEAVAERRKNLDVAMKAVEQTADPQTEAAIKIVAWVSMGMVKPDGNDFEMLRLILLALLPQVGGILLMISRTHA